MGGGATPFETDVRDYDPDDDNTVVSQVTLGDWCTLYHADSMEIVDVLKGHSPDAIIMDPPYGIRFHLGNIKRSPALNFSEYGLYAHERRGNHAVVGDTEGAELAPWLQYPNVLLWGADHLRAQLPPGGRFIGWNKLEEMEPFDQFSDIEFGWHSRAGKATVISHKWKGTIANRTGEERNGAANAPRYHPMQKPIRVMEWCIEQCRLEPGATILDPYMGSGTTAIAAFKRRMKFVGVEIDRRWFDVAVERINRQTGDGPLFDAAEPNPLTLAV